MCHNSFKAALLDSLIEQKYCDVMFILVNGDNISSICGHKFILALASDVFQAIFFGNHVNTGTIREEKAIKISDTDGESIQSETLTSAIKFYRAADKYICKDANKFVSNVLIRDLNEENAIFIYRTAMLYKCTTILI